MSVTDSDKELVRLLDQFRCDLIDGIVIKESDGDPWPLSKTESEQICTELLKRLARYREQRDYEDIWTNAYFQDQGIAPDGELRPLVSKLILRADKLEREREQEVARARLAVFRDCEQRWDDSPRADDFKMWLDRNIDELERAAK